MAGLNLLQSVSSLMSPQSFQPSHLRAFEMQMLVLQKNCLGQAVRERSKKKKKVVNKRKH